MTVRRYYYHASEKGCLVEREREKGFNFKFKDRILRLLNTQNRAEMSKIADAHSVSSCVVKTIQSNVISNGK